MAWNVTICSSPSVIKMSNKNHGEQVLGMVSPQVSPSIRDAEGTWSTVGSPKRQFYSAFDQQDEIVEEETGEDCLPGQSEKKRRLTMDQVRFLETSFEKENKLDPERKAQIATQLGLQPRQVAVWFQNRRARSKNKQLERDYNVLKADYDAIVRENEKLQAEVVRLTAQLQGGAAAGGGKLLKVEVEGGGVEGVDEMLQELGKKLAAQQQQTQQQQQQQQLGSSSCAQVGVKIEVVAKAAGAAAAAAEGEGVLGSPTKSEVVDNNSNSSSSNNNNTTTTMNLKLDDGAAAAAMSLTTEELVASGCNPLLFQHLTAVKVEGACLTEDYNLFFAQWDESCLFDPWCD